MNGLTKISLNNKKKITSFQIISVSAICLSMPETLQKLHESSKTLEQNQTAISQKIYEVQQRLETVEKEVMSYKLILSF